MAPIAEHANGALPFDYFWNFEVSRARLGRVGEREFVAERRGRIVGAQGCVFLPLSNSTCAIGSTPERRSR